MYVHKSAFQASTRVTHDPWKHQVAKGSVLLVKPVSHKPQKYYDPSVDGQCGPLQQLLLEPLAAPTAPVVEEGSWNLQGFSTEATDVFS